VEVGDDMQMQADVLFDSGQQDYWPTRIEEAIDFTQAVGDDYYHFAKDIARIRNVDGRLFAGQMSAKFYERLNTPFKMWLEGLTSQDDRDEKIMAWKAQLKMLTVAAVDEELQASSPRDMRGVSGKTGPLNIFTAKSHLMYNLRLHLDL
ncbi:type I-E CRISPR-associated protein Cse1/CasA, partial [Levilactobacillus brevis]|nr:type I-E CRISPR-associated protein Cse1/CasA [Levilactobacillus brevis]